ncbi:MAG: nucleotidyl transferase AbiEii/AbiGii toxin family protein [Parachlamydia sp.]|nr:nucleotidyl transferase AbiEii/AbiGii toxin family protein [Parachlamydia sp.]
MSTPFQSLLTRFTCQTRDDYVNAIHEIIQEITLAGLSRANFFEHAAFYGGTSLRILYGLDRFSEDLDFSLLRPQPDFDLRPYLIKAQEELRAFGVDVSIEQKIKAQPSPIFSAFLKANTIELSMLIDLPERERKKISPTEQLRIKVEVDSDPPPGFQTEVKFLLSPIPFSVRSLTLPNLFAGKMHALLFRQWKVRVKGRDWYDFVWFVSRQTRLNLSHLEMRMRQTKHWTGPERLTPDTLYSLLQTKIQHLSIEAAKNDILPFIRNRRAVEVWSRDFFLSLVPKILL